MDDVAVDVLDDFLDEEIGSTEEDTTEDVADEADDSLWTPAEKQSDLWNKGKLKVHYEKHGISEFGATSSKQYSDMAYEFGIRKSNDIIQTISNGYVYRYEPLTNIVFVGTLKGGKIKSFYKWDGREGDVVIETLKGLGLLQ